MSHRHRTHKLANGVGCEAAGSGEDEWNHLQSGGRVHKEAFKSYFTQSAFAAAGTSMGGYPAGGMPMGAPGMFNPGAAGAMQAFPPLGANFSAGFYGAPAPLMVPLGRAAVASAAAAASGS